MYQLMLLTAIGMMYGKSHPEYLQYKQELQNLLDSGNGDAFVYALHPNSFYGAIRWLIKPGIGLLFFPIKFAIVAAYIGIFIIMWCLVYIGIFGIVFSGADYINDKLSGRN